MNSILWTFLSFLTGLWVQLGRLLLRLLLFPYPLRSRRSNDVSQGSSTLFAPLSFFLLWIQNTVWTWLDANMKGLASKQVARRINVEPWQKSMVALADHWPAQWIMANLTWLIGTRWIGFYVGDQSVIQLYICASWQITPQTITHLKLVKMSRWSSKMWWNLEKLVLGATNSRSNCR